MNLPLSAANACQNETPLFRVQAKSDFSTYKKLCWAVTGSRLMLSGGFLGLLALILVLASLTPSSGGFAFWMGAALLFPLLLWWFYQNSLRRNYRGTQLVHGLTVT